MCPVCLATAALIAGKATSTGVVTAFVIKKLHTKAVVNKTLKQVKSKENQNGH